MAPNTLPGRGPQRYHPYSQQSSTPTLDAHTDKNTSQCSQGCSLFSISSASTHSHIFYPQDDLEEAFLGTSTNFPDLPSKSMPKFSLGLETPSAPKTGDSADSPTGSMRFPVKQRKTHGQGGTWYPMATPDSTSSPALLPGSLTWPLALPIL